MKRCSICGEEKPLEEFHRRRHFARSGRRSACKDCTREANRLAAKEKPPVIDRKKKRVRDLTRLAIERGELTPLPCRECGEKVVEPHHRRYEGDDAHLDIDWLCTKHHKLIHGKRDWTKQIDLIPDSR